MDGDIETTLATPGGHDPLPKPRLREVAVLSPISGSVQQPIPLSDPPILIGRDEHADAEINDTGVSRRHARITRSGNDYLIEDLGSTGGTIVNEVEVVSCVLRNGDTVRLGENVFYFDRLFMPADGESGGA